MEQLMNIFIYMLTWSVTYSNGYINQLFNNRHIVYKRPSIVVQPRLQARTRVNTPDWFYLYNKLQMERQQKMRIPVKNYPYSLRPSPYNHYQDPLKRFQILNNAHFSRIVQKPKNAQILAPWKNFPAAALQARQFVSQYRRPLPNTLQSYQIRSQINRNGLQQPQRLYQYPLPYLQHHLSLNKKNLVSSLYEPNNPVPANIHYNMRSRLPVSRPDMRNTNQSFYNNQRRNYYLSSRSQLKNHPAVWTGNRRYLERMPFNLKLTNGMKTSLKEIADRFGVNTGTRTQLFRPLSRKNLESKLRMLQKIKKAIIQKHKLQKETEMIKKQMLEWGTKELTAFTKSTIPKKMNHVKKQSIHIQISKPRLKDESDVKISYKKTIVPHINSASTKEEGMNQPPVGIKRHHIYHATGEAEKQRNPKWEYKKVHIYHKTNPVKDNSKPNEHSRIVDENAVKRVVVPYDDRMRVNANDNTEDEDDDDDDDDNDLSDDDHSSLFSDDDNVDDDEDDLPTVIPGDHKAPILNIETPNLNDVPDAMKRQLEHSPPTLYSIDKGVATPPAELREPIIEDFISSINPKMRSNVDKKSLLNDENMLHDFMHGDLTGNSGSKGKMSDEEREALREDQYATTLMKAQDKSKLDDQPEVLDVDGKKGFSPADKESISASFSHGAVPDSSMIGREGIDSSAVDLPKPSLTASSHHDNHKSINNLPHSEKYSNLQDGNDMSENAVDKQTIDGDGDYRHPMNELDDFPSQTKKSSNDYEPYDNNGPEQPMEDDHGSEDGEERYEHNSKPIELTMPHSSANVEDTIKKLQENDAMDSESLVKNFNSHLHRPIEERDRQNPSPEIGTASSQPMPLDEQQDQSDLLDPMKAQERAIHFAEAAEIATKLRNSGKDYTATFVKNSYPSTADVADSLLKSGLSQFSLPSKASSASDRLQIDSLSPEDALHALNGKATLNDILAKNADSNLSQGPPDAVVNAIQSPSARPKEDVETKAVQPKAAQNITIDQRNITTANIAISDIENATVAREVVSILESLGQVKNSLSQTENKSKESAAKTTVEETKTKPNVSKDTLSESESRTNVANKTIETVGNNSPSNIASMLSNPVSSSFDDHEERETKEAVRDLNIAIGILEKKLALMDEAKKSGNKKAIYIVDQMLRNSKGVAKSNISKPHNSKNRVLSSFKQSNETNFESKNGEATSSLTKSAKSHLKNTSKLSSNLTRRHRHHRHHRHHRYRRHHRHHRHHHRNRLFKTKQEELNKHVKKSETQISSNYSSKILRNNTTKPFIRKRNFIRKYRPTIQWD